MRTRKQNPRFRLRHRVRHVAPDEDPLFPSVSAWVEGDTESYDSGAGCDEKAA